LVWFPGTLSGMHGTNCDGFPVRRKSLLTGVCFRDKSGQNRRISVLLAEIGPAP
jgi:hypothetical protein